MLYAKIVLGLPVEGPFDYIAETAIADKIKPGMRAWVDFRNKKCVGYVVGLSRKSSIKKLKPVSGLIDDAALLDSRMLKLTKELSDYYCSSWGEMLELALPYDLRKGKSLPCVTAADFATDYGSISCNEEQNSFKDSCLIYDPERNKRWDYYLDNIKRALSHKKSVIMLFPDVDSMAEGKNIAEERLGVSPYLIYSKQSGQSKVWVNVRKAKPVLVFGSRQAVFAPAADLGLLIIDEENYFSYKQDQAPHYNAREAAFMRAEIEGAKLVLGSSTPSLEIMQLVENKKINYLPVEREKKYPKVTAVDPFNYIKKDKQLPLLTKYLEDAVNSSLNSGGKVLIFLNRKGFSTFIYCRNCEKTVKCDNCNTNLIYHYEEKSLACNKCNYKLEAPKVCPLCHASYLQYGGFGTEKAESELFRIFPDKKIGIYKEKACLDKYDIVVSTELIIRERNLNFKLIGILNIDGSLNYMDFRSAEKVFGILNHLTAMTEDNIVIQTGIPKNYCLSSIKNNDIINYYKQESAQRKLAGFPPYSHLGVIKLRGRDKERVEKVSGELFKKLSFNKKAPVGVISLNPGSPSKLRGNYYRNILLKSKSAKNLTKYLKKELKTFKHHSGIILTVDIDPV